MGTCKRIGTHMHGGRNSQQHACQITITFFFKACHMKTCKGQRKALFCAVLHLKLAIWGTMFNMNVLCIEKWLISYQIFNRRNQAAFQVHESNRVHKWSSSGSTLNIFYEPLTSGGVSYPHASSASWLAVRRISTSVGHSKRTHLHCYLHQGTTCPFYRSTGPHWYLFSL